MVNAHRGYDFANKLSRLRKTLSGQVQHESTYTKYIRVLSRYPKLRHEILESVGATRIVDHEERLKARGEQASASLIVLDPDELDSRV